MENVETEQYVQLDKSFVNELRDAKTEAEIRLLLNQLEDKSLLNLEWKTISTDSEQDLDEKLQDFRGSTSFREDAILIMLQKSKKIRF